MDCCNGLCTAEAGRYLLRTLPCKPQVPYAAGPWGGKTAFEIPILTAIRVCRELAIPAIRCRSRIAATQNFTWLPWEQAVIDRMRQSRKLLPGSARMPRSTY